MPTSKANESVIDLALLDTCHMCDFEKTSVLRFQLLFRVVNYYILETKYDLEKKTS